MSKVKATQSLWDDLDEQTYRRRIRAWTLYDWANSAFATTILAAMLPAYYSSVAGATLPSEATATGYWSLTLSISLFIIAILSPILGTISDVVRGKKRFLSIFIGIGVIATGLMILIGTGDWVLASVLMVIARTGFGGANIFYDALLPHVAQPEDQDRVSSLGYALGYLGGGLLLAINVVMFLVIPDSLFENAGIRLSFLSVAIWWAVFSIPILRQVPEPPAATESLKSGETVIGVSFRRLVNTFRSVREYRELFKYLVAFLIYNDAIGTIIGLAVIYGAELGFGTLELVMALLLVQFVGIPFSLIFGSLSNPANARRPFYLAYILFNLIALPLAGIIGASALSPDTAGALPPAYEATENFVGQGQYTVGSDAFVANGTWESAMVEGESLIPDGFFGSLTSALSGVPEDVTYAQSVEAGSRYDILVNGQDVMITYSTGPENGILVVEVDGEPLTEEITDTDGNVVEEPVVVDTYNDIIRYGESRTIPLEEPGQHTISLINTGESNPQSSGTVISFTQIEVLPPIRQSSLVTIIGILAGIQVLGLAFAFVFKRAFVSLANTLDTRRSILLSLLVYTVIAIWGFFLNATIEFWMLAFMVAIVQGGSQALSRSLYASMSPASKSGEFFGFFSIMSKFASIIGPLLFATAVAIFGSSRPAILSLVALFVLGGYLLTRVDIAKGQQIARQEDNEVFTTANA